MNYISWKDFNVAGKDTDKSISLATYEDGEIVLQATEGLKYGEERSIEVPLNDITQVRKLIKGLMNVYETLHRISTKRSEL
jgi:hypothetical protein